MPKFLYFAAFLAVAVPAAASAEDGPGSIEAVLSIQDKRVYDDLFAAIPRGGALIGSFAIKINKVCSVGAGAGIGLSESRGDQIDLNLVCSASLGDGVQGTLTVSRQYTNFPSRTMIIGTLKKGSLDGGLWAVVRDEGAEDAYRAFLGYTHKVDKLALRGQVMYQTGFNRRDLVSITGRASHPIAGMTLFLEGKGLILNQDGRNPQIMVGITKKF
jgi:hypothetical protein